MRTRRNETRTLAFDPASYITGYALLLAESETLLETGRLKGKPTRAGADVRVRSILGDLGPLVRDTRPAVILVELPLEKQHTRQKGKKSSMAVWAMAAGRVCGYLEHMAATMDDGPQVIAISNTRWTQDLKMGKEGRQVAAACQFRAYDASADSGMDISDAIMMACWWARRWNDRLFGKGGAAG